MNMGLSGCQNSNFCGEDLMFIFENLNFTISFSYFYSPGPPWDPRGDPRCDKISSISEIWPALCFCSCFFVRPGLFFSCFFHPGMFFFVFFRHGVFFSCWFSPRGVFSCVLFESYYQITKSCYNIIL